VLGHVNRPGRYPLDQTSTSLTDALAVAGGVDDGGADYIIIAGVRGGKAFRKEVDLNALFVDGSVADEGVMGGDSIYVARAPTYYIYGEVQHPGVYRIERNMTVMQGLAQGGGPTLRGSERSLRVFRRNANGVEMITPKTGDLLQPGDVIHVPEGWF